MEHILKTIMLLVATSNFSFAQQMTHRIDSIVKSHYVQHTDLGISVGFIQNDQEYYTAYGTLSKESKIDVNKNSVFEIASITKIITANLIAQAVLEEKLKLNDFIDDYLPKGYLLHENLKEKIKISDLASHQSGLPDIDFGKLIANNSQQPVSSVDMDVLVSIINASSELIDYGQYRYSTIGYVLLGQILEEVYSKSYDEIIREKIITPLQMANTLTEDFDVAHRTTGYNPDGGVQEFFEWNITGPAGLLKSNASDMITYLKAVLNKENPIDKAAQLTEKMMYKDANREMGLGLGIVKDDKNTIYMKSGDSMGQSSILCYNRAKNWGIIILLNQRNWKLRQNLLNEIYESVLK